MNSLIQAQLTTWREIPPQASNKRLLENYNKLLRKADVQKEYIQNVDQEAIAEAAGQGIDIKTMNELRSKISPVTLDIPTPTGVSSIRLSPEDILDFAQNDEESQRKLIIKFGAKYESILNLKEILSSL